MRGWGYQNNEIFYSLASAGSQSDAAHYEASTSDFGERVALRESTAFTQQRSRVQSPYRSLDKQIALKTDGCRVIYNTDLGLDSLRSTPLS